MNYPKNYSLVFTFTKKDLEPEPVELPGGICPVTVSEWSQELQAKRKAEGRCIHCGELLPMSAFGLGDCKVCSP